MDNNSFSYTYSASEKAEAQKIKDKYSVKKEVKASDIELLRALDRKVYKTSSTISLVVGIIGCLIMGFGMSLIMTELYKTLNIEFNMLYGIIIGVIGLALVISAYPIYLRTLKCQRKKAAPRIMELAEKI